MVKAFTLIELLIVVAIIAILAAIAVPNFLEAQTRSKISRNKADMRTQVTALEAYYVDNNKYPPAADVNIGNGPEPNVAGSGFHARMPSYLTTPISYITSLSEDPFVTQGGPNYFSNALYPVSTRVGSRYAYFYWNYYLSPAAGGTNPDGFPTNLWGTDPNPWTGAWLIYGYGPDRNPFHGTAATFLPYDATNGTISAGNIIRTQRNTDGINPHPVTGTFNWS
ncbi:MAG: prepilin-type N-terminal cleavage/methylation domain-containing protein [Candidatus Sumerlaeia bacterium]|nr:prepilin-type N-terminal cleavage/methylation domain-containing protein [Candidatus Sumerlaeia bacterium]